MKRAVANSVVQALIWRLRDLRIRVGIVEMEQAAAVLQAQEEWTKTDLQHVLLPIFAKRQESRTAVLTLIEELLSPPAKTDTIQSAANDEVTPVSESFGTTSLGPSALELFWDWLDIKIQQLLSTRWLPGALWILGLILFVSAILILFSGLVRDVLDRAALIARAVSGALFHPLGNDLRENGQDFEGFQIALLVRHVTASALVATGVVVILAGFRVRTRKAKTGRRDPTVEVRAPAVGDGSVFRAGWLGGRPLPFLDAQLASEIVELITYRQTDRFRNELDLRATVERRVRGDMDSLVFERRKELPTVVILIDGTTQARHWNTLAAEFQAALEKRGLAVEAFIFHGSFSRPNWNARIPGETIEMTLNTIAERSGWLLTTVFADLKRFSARDTAVLAALREQGPVLAFDYADPRLWDNRHAAFENLGIGPYAATGYSLRQALAVAFAPDRGAIRTMKPPPSTKAVFHHLSEPQTHWATVCAMIEPISFALAEKLRKAHPMLADRNEALAFSLLSSLTESWIGPEGLRFSPDIRQTLLSRASDIPRDQQFAFFAVFDAAFDQEPTAVTAGELWRYTRAQAELFTTPRKERALQDLADIKASGIIDSTAFDDFVSRLRQPDPVLEPGTIQLPSRLSKMPLLALSPDIGSDESEDGVVYARWSLGLSEVRVRIGTTMEPLAAFLPEGRFFLAVDRGGGGEPCSTVDAVRGTREPVGQLASFSTFNLTAADFAELSVFSNGHGGILTTRNGRLFSLLKIDGSEQDRSPNMALKEIAIDVALGGNPIVALSRTDDTIACVRRGSNEILIISDFGEKRPQQLTAPGRITALTFSQKTTLLYGDEAGNVFELPLDGENQPRSSGARSDFSRPVARFDIEIAAVTEFYGDDGKSRTLVAALSDGRIILADDQNRQRSYDSLSWRPKWLTAFPDRKAALDNGRAVGVSIAVTGEDGQFGVIGLDERFDSQAFVGLSLIEQEIDPARDGLAVLAINPERRRLVVRNGPSLEVRPLVYDLPDVDEQQDEIPPVSDPNRPLSEVDPTVKA